MVKVNYDMLNDKETADAFNTYFTIIGTDQGSNLILISSQFTNILHYQNKIHQYKKYTSY